MSAYDLCLILCSMWCEVVIDFPDILLHKHVERFIVIDNLQVFSLE